MSGKRKGLLMAALMAVFSLGIASFSYFTAAWFSNQRSATVNFSNLKTSEGLSVSVDYCKLNLDHGATGGSSVSNGYLINNAGTLVTNNYSGTYTYSNLFAAAGTDTSKLKHADGAPQYAATYSLKVINNSGAATIPTLYLMGFLTPHSTLDAVAEGNETDGYTVGDYFSLNSVLRVYCQYTSTPDTDLSTFLNRNVITSTNTAEGAVSDSTGDVFVDSNGDKYPLNSGATGNTVSGITDKWATGSSLASGSTGYFLITIYYSDDSSTFYEETSTATVDSQVVTLYSKSTSGNSNAYQSLDSFAFSSLLLNGE